MKIRKKSALIFVLGVVVGMIAATCLETHNLYCVCKREAAAVLALSPPFSRAVSGEDTISAEHSRAVAEPQESQPQKCDCDRRDGERDTDPRPVVKDDYDYDSFSENPSQSPRVYSDEPWEFITKHNVHNGLMTQPGFSLSHYRSKYEEIKMAKAKLADAASGHFKKNMKVTAMSDAYLRRDPLQGTKYMFDVELMDMESDEERPFNARIELSRVFEHKWNTSVITYKDLETVNFIVPVMNVKERFRDFMQMYEKHFLRQHEKVRLILVVYGRASLTYVRRTLWKYHMKYRHADITIIDKPSHQFSRSRALDTGMAELNDSDLAFFCDVDLKIHQSFAQRCRRNTIQGERVYFPEVFKMYNLDFVYWNEEKPLYPYIATRAHGHWGSYGYGMVCVYKSDYLKVGGLNTSIVGWGGEDVDFYEQVKNEMDLMQAPDTALWHRWHPKECSPQLSKSQYDNCMKSKYECLADRKELASLIYEKEIQP